MVFLWILHFTSILPHILVVNTGTINWKTNLIAKYKHKRTKVYHMKFTKLCEPMKVWKWQSKQHINMHEGFFKYFEVKFWNIYTHFCGSPTLLETWRVEITLKCAIEQRHTTHKTHLRNLFQVLEELKCTSADLQLCANSNCLPYLILQIPFSFITNTEFQNLYRQQRIQ